MFNKFGQGRPYTPRQPQKPSNQTSPSSGSVNNSGISNPPFQPQITPDFMQHRSTRTSVSQTRPVSGRHLGHDSFAALTPSQQRTALFNQAHELNKLSRHPLPRDLRSALPGGLTEKQRLDFDALQRTNPAAAQEQLLNYQRNMDIRYNKPNQVLGNTPTQSSDSRLSHHQPRTNYRGSRRLFGR